MQIEFVGDVITQPFGRIKAQLGLENCTVEHHGIDQHFQTLMSPTMPDVLVCHARTSFFTDGLEPSEALKAAEGYCRAVQAFAAQGRSLVVLNTLVAQTQRLVGLDHLRHRGLVSDLNAMLADCAANEQFVAVADLAGVLLDLGLKQAVNEHNNLVMRMPYTKQALPALIGEYARTIRERFVPRKKVLVLDADNTLWGGIVGEDGVDRLQVGQEFPGSVYMRFQKQLLEVRKSGVLLALVTKNNEADAKEAFDRLDMPLKWDSFAAKRANWETKSRNIEAIAQELNVGLDSMVFIDDNPFEIEEVRSSLPMVACAKFDGKDANLALNVLNGIADLGCWSLTQEDMAKSEQYVHEQQRKALSENALSIDDYISSLEIRLEAGRNRRAHVKRISQLTNKTNQFNLTTRRYSEADILVAMEQGAVYDFRLIDRFGDMGIIAVVIVRDGMIEAFLMSCRALGRRAEQAILDYCCRQHSEWPLAAEFISSSKNMMVQNFYDECGFSITADVAAGKKYMLAHAPAAEVAYEVTEVC